MKGQKLDSPLYASIYTYTQIFQTKKNPILHSQFQAGMGCRHSYKRLLKKARRKKRELSMKLTTLAVDYSFC